LIASPNILSADFNAIGSAVIVIKKGLEKTGKSFLSKTE